MKKFDINDDDKIFSRNNFDIILPINYKLYRANKNVWNSSIKHPLWLARLQVTAEQYKNSKYTHLLEFRTLKPIKLLNITNIDFQNDYMQKLIIIELYKYNHIFIKLYKYYHYCFSLLIDFQKLIQ